MQMFFTDIRNKEVINVSTGLRLGYVNDIEVDVNNGNVLSIIVPGQGRYLGLFGRDEDCVIPWENVSRIGEDIILVDILPKRRRH